MCVLILTSSKKDYADNEDARKYDPRLRGPVSEAELAVDPNTGMKNYIANERGNADETRIYRKRFAVWVKDCTASKILERILTIPNLCYASLVITTFSLMWAYKLALTSTESTRIRS